MATGEERENYQESGHPEVGRRRASATQKEGKVGERDHRYHLSRARGATPSTEAGCLTSHRQTRSMGGESGK